MNDLKAISVSGVLAGFVVLVATTIVLSILSPFLFADLVRSGDLDVLMTSPGPLAFALGVTFIASAFGVFVSGKVADKLHWINVILVIACYVAFTYWLSLSPSNQAKPYPDWYVLLSHAVLVPGAIAGYYAAKKFAKTT